jgi:hypothetical protein
MSLGMLRRIVWYIRTNASDGPLPPYSSYSEESNRKTLCQLSQLNDGILVSYSGTPGLKYRPFTTQYHYSAKEEVRDIGTFRMSEGKAMF